MAPVTAVAKRLRSQLGASWPEKNWSHACSSTSSKAYCLPTLMRSLTQSAFLLHYDRKASPFWARLIETSTILSITRLGVFHFMTSFFWSIP